MTGQVLTMPSRRAVQDTPYAWLVVILLMLTYTIGFLDRQVLNLLVEPVKHDLGISDTQFSLLQGIAFIASYLSLGIVFGRLADTYNRRNLIIFGLVVWSLFSMACGFTTNYLELLLARIAVGAAEAALAPCAISIISDYFSKTRVPRALSVQYLGTYLGGGLALLFGGLVLSSAGHLAEALPLLKGHTPWQMAFIMIGAPGLVMAVFLLLIKEPARTSFDTTQVVDDRQFTLAQTLGYFWQERSFFLRFLGAMTLIVLVLFTIPAWTPALLSRAYGTDPREIGFLFGSLSVLCGCVGVLGGPVLNGFVARAHAETSVLRCIAGGAAVLFVACALIAVAPTAGTVIALASIATLCYSMPQALGSTALLSVIPNRMRGTAQALYIVCVTGIGLGCGPTLVAAITDFVLGDPKLLGWSLSAICAVSGLGATWLAIAAIGPYRRLLDKQSAMQTLA